MRSAYGDKIQVQLTENQPQKQVHKSVVTCRRHLHNCCQISILPRVQTLRPY